METVDTALPKIISGLSGGAWAGGGGLLLAALLILGVLAGQAKTAAEKKEFNESIERFFGSIATGIGRYVSGRELVDEPRSEATWWKAGAPLPDDERTETPVAELGLNPPSTPAGVSLDKAVPRSRAARIGSVLVYLPRLLGGALAGIWRVLRVWHRWPRFTRSAVRLAPLPVAWGFWRYPHETQLALIAVAGAVFLAALTGPSGLNLWRFTPAWTAGQIYGPGIWVAVRQILRLDDKETRARWLSVPDDMNTESPRIVLRLKVEWLGSPEAAGMIERIIGERVPGEWVAEWGRTGKEHFVAWTPKPKPKVRPKLPDYVPWKPTGDPRRVFVGMAIEEFDLVEAVIQTQTATPHWGVAGDTGSGKSTVLYIPVVHGRQHGELIDILDTKRNSLIEAEGFSGVRVHKTVRACVAAFAEFLASMMAAEAAAEKGADPALKAMLVPRTLVIDELPTLIKLAYIWWRHGLKAKGAPPFLDWLGIILLQGRSSNHRVVIGAQQFANSYFGGTMERAQIGTRLAVGQQDRTSWGVAFGQSTPVLGFDTDVKGRGAYSDKRKDPEADYVYVREIQPCYITPDVAKYLAQCPPAPAWFDEGQMAPWITPESLAETAETAATASFIPGGKYGPPSLPTVAIPSHPGVAGGSPSSQGTTAIGATGRVTAHATIAEAELAAEEEAIDASLPDTYTLTEAFERGILPWKAATVRTYRKRGEARGIAFPEGVNDGSTSYYTEEELKAWLTEWEKWQSENNVKRPRDGAAHDSDKEGAASA